MKLKFCSLSSGSSGNCHYVKTEDTSLLIDAGFSGKKIEGLLDKIGEKPNELDGILITHEHTDHIKGAGVMSRRYNLPIYANKGTWEAMEDKIGKISLENIKVIDTNKYFSLRDLDILATSIYHDAKEPVGYILNKSNKKISIVTDTGILDERLLESMSGSNIYLLESNHDVQMLRSGNYPISLQNRIISDFGHLSNSYAAESLSRLVEAKGEIVLLGHLSKDNNCPRTAFNEVAFRLMELGIDIRRDVLLNLTHRNKPTEIFTI